MLSWKFQSDTLKSCLQSHISNAREDYTHIPTQLHSIYSDISLKPDNLKFCWEF